MAHIHGGGTVNRNCPSGISDIGLTRQIRSFDKYVQRTKEKRKTMSKKLKKKYNYASPNIEYQ